MIIWVFEKLFFSVKNLKHQDIYAYRDGDNFVWNFFFFAREFLTASNSTNCGIENKCLKGWQQTKIMADFSVLLRRNLRTWDLRLQKLKTFDINVNWVVEFLNPVFNIILFHRKRENTQLPMLKVLLLFQYSDKKSLSQRLNWLTKMTMGGK